MEEACRIRLQRELLLEAEKQLLWQIFVNEQTLQSVEQVYLLVLFLSKEPAVS